MKSFSVRLRMPGSIILLTAVLLLWSIGARAQKTVETGKQKYTIHITREVDGKSTQIDTSFETRDNFDVDTWVNQHGSSAKAFGNKKTDMNVEVSIPDLETEGMPKVPDTLIINGDTAIVNVLLGNKMEINQESGDLDTENQFGLQSESFPAPGCCQQHCRRSKSLKGIAEGQPLMMPFGGFGLPGMENLMSFGELENLTIKTRRHGKKVIMTFRDSERHGESKMHSERGNVFFFNDGEKQSLPGNNKKVIIIGSDATGKEKEMNMKVEKSKEGNKEVIIIRKKAEDEK